MRSLLLALLLLSTALRTPFALTDDVQYVLFDGTQESLQATLKDQEKHVIYETVTVPGTCEKEVLVGYEQQCNWIPKPVCHDEPVQVCKPTSTENCHTEWNQVCENKPKQVCGWETDHVCQTTNHQVCNQVNKPVCWDVDKEVCVPGGKDCHTIKKCNDLPPPMQTCWEEEVCSDGKPVCHIETEHQCRDNWVTECHNEPTTVCSDTQEYVCHTEYEQVCENKPQQVCETTTGQTCHTEWESVCTDQGHQECKQVPVYETQTYSCPTQVQKPVGEELDFNVNASVSLNVKQSANPIRPSEKIAVKLSATQTSLALAENTKKYLVIAEKGASSVKVTKPDAGPKNPGQKQVTSAYQVWLVPPGNVTFPVQLGLDKLTILTGGKLQFQLGGRLYVPRELTVTAKIERLTASGSAITAVQATIPHEQLVFSVAKSGPSIVTADLKPYLKEKLQKAKYRITLDVAYLAKPTPELLNPELLPAKATAKATKTAEITLVKP